MLRLYWRSSSACWVFLKPPPQICHFLFYARVVTFTPQQIRSFVTSVLLGSQSKKIQDSQTDSARMNETQETQHDGGIPRRPLGETVKVGEQNKTSELMGRSGVEQRKMDDLMEVWRQWAGRRGIREAAGEGQDEIRRNDQWTPTQNVSA